MKRGLSNKSGSLKNSHKIRYIREKFKISEENILTIQNLWQSINQSATTEKEGKIWSKAAAFEGNVRNVENYTNHSNH